MHRPANWRRQITKEWAWPAPEKQDPIPYSSRNILLLATEPRQGWMPKATAIIYPPRVQADQTNLLMHAALKLKVLINLHLGKRVPNDED